MARAWAGLALVALGVAALAAAVFGVRHHLIEHAAQLHDTEEANARLAGALARGQQMRDAGAAGGAASFVADYLESVQDSIATADLQSRLRAMAIDKRVDLASLNTLSPRQTGDVTFVGVRLTFRAALPAVQALLHGSETSQPILFVERLTVRADAAPVSGLGRGINTDERGQALAVEMDVYAPKRPRGLAAAGSPAVRVEPASEPAPALRQAPGTLRP